VIVQDIKCWPEYFQAVWIGDKTFELRRDDRGYAVGDILHLKEWSPGKPVGCPVGCPLRHVHEWETPPGYTGREQTARVTYVFKGGSMGLKEGYVILSFERLQRASTRLKATAL
jgi:hypothetical protein